MLSPRCWPAAAAVVLAVAALAGCGSPPPGRLGQWQQDIGYLATELPRVHVNGLTGVSQPAWDAAVRRLEARLPRLSNGQVILGIRRLVALLHDDETDVELPPTSVYPLALQWVGGGLYLVAVPHGSQYLLGARLTAIDGHPLSQVLARLRPEVDYQDPGVLAAAEADELIEANTLYWLGVTRSPTSAAFTVRTVPGSTVTVRLTAGRAESLPWAARALAAARNLRQYFPRERWVLTGYGSANLVHVPLPAYEQNLMQPYWMTLLPGGTVYLKYNECLDTGGFQRLAARALAVLRSHPGDRLVVDLRNNPGGDTASFQPLIAGIRADPAINRTGRIFALVNQLTDSSATVDAGNLGQQTRAILIGQPPEDPIDEYGDDGNILRLPYRGIAIQYTTKIVNDTRTRLGLPGITIAPTLWQIRTGQDPVLRAALAYR